MRWGWDLSDPSKFKNCRRSFVPKVNKGKHCVQHPHFPIGTGLTMMRGGVCKFTGQETTAEDCQKDKYCWWTENFRHVLMAPPKPYSEHEIKTKFANAVKSPKHGFRGFVSKAAHFTSMNHGETYTSPKGNLACQVEARLVKTTMHTYQWRYLTTACRCSAASAASKGKLKLVKLEGKPMKLDGKMFCPACPQGQGVTRKRGWLGEYFVKGGNHNCPKHTKKTPSKFALSGTFQDVFPKKDFGEHKFMLRIKPETWGTKGWTNTRGHAKSFLETRIDNSYRKKKTWYGDGKWYNKIGKSSQLGMLTIDVERGEIRPFFEWQKAHLRIAAATRLIAHRKKSLREYGFIKSDFCTSCRRGIRLA